MLSLDVLAWSVPVSALLGAIICTVMAFSQRNREWAHLPAWLGLGVAVIGTYMLMAWSATHTDARVLTGFRWVDAGSVSINVGLRLDSLTLVQLAVVTSISFLVVIYSQGYMHGDPGYPRFFAVFSGFVFCMTMLVMASNLLVLYAFWEGVGLCSYLLIGFWYRKESASKAALKAFLVNRVADCGFLIGILLLAWGVGSVTPDVGLIQRLDYNSIFAAVPKLAESNPQLLNWIALLLLVGAMGKSAQFPLHVWLPDAMEGPTPVSALIHAATMVTAGVYLLCRMSPLMSLAPDVLLLAGWVGGITALMAAIMAAFQDDLKRVLAYSTVSQLGYLFLALGTGAVHDLVSVSVFAAMFHLLTHAFFKALLFLAAGNVMHAMGDVIDMRSFSGLKKCLPRTNITFAIGAAALAGIPPLAGFWSKDGILALLFTASQSGEHRLAYLTLFGLGVATAALTSIYIFRAYFRTFHGAYRVPEEAGDHPHEATEVMLAPMSVLAIGSLSVGAILGPTHWIATYLGRTPTLPPAHAEGESILLMVISAVIAFAGLAIAWITTRSEDFNLGKFGETIADFGRNRFYIDQIYHALIVRPLEIFSSVLAWIDRNWIDEFWLTVAALPGGVSGFARRWQNGETSSYALAMAFGIVLLLLFIALK